MKSPFVAFHVLGWRGFLLCFLLSGEPVCAEFGKALHDLRMLPGEIGFLTDVGREVGEKQSLVFRTQDISGGGLEVADQFPIALAHGPLRALRRHPSGARRAAMARSADRITGTMLLPSMSGLSSFTPHSSASVGSQSHAWTSLAAHLALGQMPRPGDDGRQPDAALEQAELRAAIRSRAAAAEMRAFFRRMAVVGLKDDDGPLAQAEVIQLLQQRADAFVHVERNAA